MLATFLNHRLGGWMYPVDAGIAYQSRVSSRKRRCLGRCSHSSGGCQANLHFYVTLDIDVHV